MKKPPVENPIDKLSLKLWREEIAAEDISDGEHALQDAKARLDKDHKKELAGKVMQIIQKNFTKRQIEVFNSFVETGSYRETARVLGLGQSHVFRVVTKIQKVVKGNIGYL